MQIPSQDEPASNPLRRTFQTTSWTLVEQAGGGESSSREALGQLCKAYWHPLFVFYQRYEQDVGRRGEAEDAVQSFFAWLIESNVIERADSDRGRFRTFLLAAFKQFLAREHQYRTAQKRRPDRPVISIDAVRSASHVVPEPFHELTPERLFDYSWALEVVDRAMNRLRGEWIVAGRRDRFELLKSYISGGKEINGRDLAASLGITEGAARVAIHRLKQRYAELLREEVGKTASSEAEIDAELGYLFSVLRG